MSYFHDTMWDLTMIEQNHYSAIDSLQHKSFWKPYYLQGNHLCHFLHQSSVARYCFKNLFSSNLVQTETVLSPHVWGWWTS